jgi:hypothetical protein
MIESEQPSGETECAIVVQMAAVHAACMVVLGRLGGGHGGDRHVLATATAASRLSRSFAVLGACPNSHCSILSESDSTLGYEQVFSSLESRSDPLRAPSEARPHCLSDLSRSSNERCSPRASAGRCADDNCRSSGCNSIRTYGLHSGVRRRDAQAPANVLEWQSDATEELMS